MAHVSGHWVHDIDPCVVHFPKSWPIHGVHWYGLAYLFSFLFLAGTLRFRGNRGRLPFPRERVDEFLGAVVLGVLVGGRLGYVFLYDWSFFREHFLEIFCIWNGGMASHGGFLGIFFALFYFSAKHEIPLLPLLDLLVPLAPVGFFFGRIANFVNGEVYGRISSVPWAIIFPHASPGGVPIETIAPRHPSQLYEALFEGIVLFIYAQWRLHCGKVLRWPGRLTGEFLLFYGIVRIAVECFREPDAPTIFSMTRGQFYSLFLIGIGFFFVRTAKRCSLRRD
ncbi:MAG: prolipoprotein diacylglyceryl transferase [Puniceicoccales bacterium]|jgi:phosphatidylglycerol:prolipoprotein diacylglycerol transferase|nr:prolipoprotein diacylglyceryl transferase [Puniceicoccales bacterium]